MKLKNWAGNLSYAATNIVQPTSTEQLQDIVKMHKKIRVVGSRHSFNRIADTTENLISFEKLNSVVSFDEQDKIITVQGGIKYGDVCTFLHRRGFALHNLASLPHISVAGSIATATHGSGIRNGNLATAVCALEFLNWNGDIVKLSRKDGEAFNGAVVSLGALGPVLTVSLDVQSSFEMQQLVYRSLPMDVLKDHFLAVMSAGYSVSLFTDWTSRSFNEVWVKDKVINGKVNSFHTKFYDAIPADKNLHPIGDQPAENCTEQCGVPGPWYERLPHFKMGFTPSAGAELQSEYFVSIEHAYDAINTLYALREKIAPHIFISEVRTIDADDLWMSPCYGRRCVALHTTWKQHPEVAALLPLIEKQLDPFEPLPHWGKLFALKPSVIQKRLKKLNDFKSLMLSYDPEGKFRNAFIDEVLFSK